MSWAFEKHWVLKVEADSVFVREKVRRGNEV